MKNILKIQLLLILLCSFNLFAKTQTEKNKDWEQIIYPDQELQQIILHPSNPEEITVLWKKGLGYSINGGKTWAFIETKAQLQKINAFSDQLKVITGPDKDAEKRNFRKYFIYQTNEHQALIYAEDKPINIGERVFKDIIFTNIFFAKNNPALIYLSTKDQLLQCSLNISPAIIHYKKQIPGIWKNLNWNSGLIHDALLTEEPEVFWIFSKQTATDLAPWSIWRFQSDNGPVKIDVNIPDYKKQRIYIDQKQPLQAEHYYYNHKTGRSFFSEANGFVYSTRYGEKFTYRPTLFTVDGSILKPLFVSGKSPEEIYVLGEVADISGHSLLNELANYKKAVPNLFELELIGQQKYFNTWETLTELEKSAFYQRYLKENYKGISENLVRIILNDVKFTSNKIGIYRSSNFNPYLTFVSLLPFEIKDVRNTKIYVSADNKILYVLNKGLWKLHL